MAESEGISKVQITLILGIVSWFVWCVPFVNSLLYMVCLVGTMVMGFLAHQEAAETGESTTMAKVGMALSVGPIVAIVALIVLTFCGFGGLAVLGNM